jgi:hypothetical protein
MSALESTCFRNPVPGEGSDSGEMYSSLREMCEFKLNAVCDYLRSCVS